MRYYEFVIEVIQEEFEMNEEKSVERRYDFSIRKFNDSIYSVLDKEISMFAYQEVDAWINVVFCYNEKKELFQDCFSHIVDIIHKEFNNLRIDSPEITEITLLQFKKYIEVSQRKNYLWIRNDFSNMTKLSIVYDSLNKKDKPMSFNFEEKMIAEKDCDCNDIMYNDEFVRELNNIKSHKIDSEYNGNIGHYIISSHSFEASLDMAERLSLELYKANRVSSRRIEIIREISPSVYLKKTIEMIIENNYGGIVVFDLSCEFGKDCTKYQEMSNYIEMLVKKYKNHSLFMFFYEIDNPGFSYSVLPQICQEIFCVPLKEGTGNRKKAISYLKALINKSEHAEFVGETGEFMKKFPQKEFSQTDIIRAFEQFPQWCRNKNLLESYNYNSNNDFIIEREMKEESSYEALCKMIGLNGVKKQVEKIIASNIIEKERRKRKGICQTGTMHMIFAGNPGSAKTTVAKHFAGIMKEKGIIKSGAFIERNGTDIEGFSCVENIRESFLAAKGGVLFIDEAYSLKSDRVITALIQEMENRRDEVIVVFAGYNQRMRDFIKLNEGLKSRVPYWIDFVDYNASELKDIFVMMVEERGFTVTEAAVSEVETIFEKICNIDDFGNGRYVRNLIDEVLQKQSSRLLSSNESVDDIRTRELFQITKEDIYNEEEGIKNENVTGAAKKELDSMVGLKKVKSVLEKAIASQKRRRLCFDRGIESKKASLHMVFSGNPGTAKTTVARLLARIMKDEKMLSTGAFVEVGRAELVGTHVGTTAPLVKKRFKEAQGGILFIDEAYSLCDSYNNGFGHEAINTIVQEMENHRDKVTVVFAGYPQKMEEFLKSNPGLSSRIAFHVDFEDYSTDELCEITEFMLAQKQLKIEKNAMKKLRNIYDISRTQNDYGNGRFVRKTIEVAEMNLALRLSEFKKNNISTELLTTIEKIDIPNINRKIAKQEKRKIGFRV